MSEKTLWLGFYIKERNVNRIVRYFEEGIDIKEVIKEKKYSLKELENLAEQEFKKAEKSGVEILFRGSRDYPEDLKPIPYAPVFLYIKGILNLKEPLIAVIGSRKPTNYGKEVAYKFSKSLAEKGIGVISGLARGIDSVAHRACLEANGYTIAVLGSGIDVIYPAENRDLYQEILEKRGAIISELPFGTRPRKENFPLRNRIISGLSKGVLVVEAGKKSGTLITAKWALNQGKEVFAVPGNVFSAQSQGTHYLLKQGAVLVSSPEDILEYLDIETPELKETSEKTSLELTEEEEEVLELLSPYPQHIEEIFIKTDKPSFEVLSILTDLELKGLVEILPGKYVKLKVQA